MKFKKNEDGTLVLDDNGDPIAVSDKGEVIDLTKVVALGKFQRVESEREEFKTQVETLQGDIAGLKESAGDAAALKTKVDELTAKSETEKAEFESRLAAVAKDRAIDTSLLGAGVPEARLKAARALLDVDSLSLDDKGSLSGFDAESFKRDNGYLFDQKPVSSAAPARGAAGGDDDVNDAQTRAAMGLPDPKE